MKKFLIFILLIVLVVSVVFISGIIKDVPPKHREIPGKNPVAEEIEKEVTLYFSSDNINTLSPEKRVLKVSDESEIYLLTLEALISGPKNEGHNAAIHPETTVNSIKINGDVATVDFTESLRDKNTGGSTREFMCIYSVVNTLCEFEDINKVVFKINGKSISTFGQFDMSEPFEADKSLIK